MKACVAKALAWCALLLIAGCGGGSDGDGNGLPGPGAGSKAVITSEEAPAMAGGVVDAALEAGLFGSMVGPVPLAGPVQISKSRSGRLFAKIAGVEMAKQVLAESQAQAGLLSDPIGPETVACTVSGSFTFSGELADPLTFTAGDNFSFDYDNCDNGDGVLVDGGFTMLIESFAGDLLSGEFDMALGLTLSGFQITQDGETASGDGDLTITVDTSLFPLNSVTVSGDALTLSAGGITETLSSFSVTETLDQGVFPEAYSVDASGTFTSSQFEGEVTFVTTMTLEGSGDDYPSSGEFVITGADDASITVIALDSQNVRLEVDLDGDGAVDVTIDTTWVILSEDA